MAATAHPLATAVAIDVLKGGGSAVDGAIAANALLGLVEPVGCGIGGDLFAIVWDPRERRLFGLNASGRAPAARTLESVRRALGGAAAIPRVGPLSVTVPGCVDGWAMLSERFGALPLAEALAPATRYAEAGAPVPEVIAHYWGRNLEAFERHHREGRWLPELDPVRALYAPGGSAPAAGSLFRNPDLATTYRQIARGGRDAFYEGRVAEAVERAMRRLGGDLTADDLAAHRSEWVEPWSASYRGCEVHELGPNTQGVAALQMLQLLEPWDLGAMGFGSADAIHLTVEAKRLAFEDRARFYADPAVEMPIERLLSRAYAEARRDLIDETRARASAGPGDPALDGDTTYLAVADERGMMVSLIQSNYRGMGSGVVVDGAGFMLQNRGELFALDPAHPNVVGPSKRPFHTIIPAFATRDGEPWLAFGLMGGAMQPQGHVQILQNLLDHGMGLQEAGDAPRWRHDGSTEPTDSLASAPAGVGSLCLEPGLDPAIEAELAARGHAPARHRTGFGGYQAVERLRSGVYRGASEMRKDGCALGY